RRNNMQNNIWSIHGQVYECAQCENYIPGDRIRTKCLGCRHEYDAHTDEESAEMDYPKPDLFKYKANTEVTVD
ncbi:hypothetical protein, partial [Ruminococcus sp.]|uniref:hypothetical protein n=1 Tax=Ruminococcus sp. TaxID=41978 RepID=UPI0025DCD8B1